MKALVISIAFYPIFGYPLIMYGGIITFLLFVAVACLGKKAMKNPGPMVRKHMLLAYITLGFALFHGLLGMLIFL